VPLVSVHNGLGVTVLSSVPAATAQNYVEEWQSFVCYWQWAEK